MAAGKREVEDGGIFDSVAEVVPDDRGTGALDAVTGVEGTVDGDASVLGDGGLSEDVAARLVEEALNLQRSSESVLPAVEEST